MQPEDKLDKTLPPDHDDQDTMNTLDSSAEADSPVPSMPSHPFISQGKADAVPDQIGPYTITGIIGSGGMGIVYEATQEQPKRRVALKVVKAGQASESAKRRFKFEVQTLAKLQHRGIAGVYEAGIYTGGGHEQPYFAMEYIPGARPLTDYAKDEDLDVKARLDLFMQICDAIHHGHQKGIIHRDLKPDNILVDRDGNPKIIDFGIARATDADIAVTTMQTSVGQILGTLQYMSPEQCLGDPDLIDTRADVYSLGVIFYELLCDELPYDVSKQALVEAVRIIREEKPSRPSTITKFVRGDLETISMKALEKTSARRYDSAASFKRDIERYLNREPIEARPPSLVYQVSMFTRRHRFTAVAASVTILAIIGGLIATSIAWVHAAEQTRIAVEQRGIAETQRAEAETQRTIADEQRAEAEAARDMAEQETARAEAVKEFVTTMLSSVDPATAGSMDKELMKLVLAQASDEVGEKFKDQPLVEAEIRDVIGTTYRSLGQYDDAEPHVIRAMDLYRNQLGEEHLDTISSINNLSLMLAEQGKYAEALPYSSEVLETLRRVYGDEHPYTIDAIGNMGSTLSELNRFDEGMPYYEEVLEARRRTLGNEDRKTLTAINNMGHLLKQQEKYDEAMPYYVEAMETRRRVLGNDHPDTLTSISNLGQLFQMLGRYEEAMKYYEESLDGRRRVLGRDHPDTFSSVGMIGELLVVQEKYEEAMPYYEEALAGRRRVLGNEHPRTIISINNMGMLLKDQGKYEEAMPYMIEVVETCRAVLGHEHRFTLLSAYNISSVLMKQSQYATAEVYLDEAFKGMMIVFGSTHSRTIQARRRLVKLYELWHESEPEAGHDAKAAVFRDQLAAVEVP